MSGITSSVIHHEVHDIGNSVTPVKPRFVSNLCLIEHVIQHQWLGLDWKKARTASMWSILSSNNSTNSSTISCRAIQTLDVLNVNAHGITPVNGIRDAMRIIINIINLSLTRCGTLYAIWCSPHLGLGMIIYVVVSFISDRIQQWYRNRKTFCKYQYSHDIETLLHSAGGHQGSRKAHQADNQKKHATN